MTKLKLGPIVEDKPVKVTVELPGPLHRDLVAYADYLNSLHVHVSWTEVKHAGIEARPVAEGGCGTHNNRVAGTA